MKLVVAMVLWILQPSLATAACRVADPFAISTLDKGRISSQQIDRVWSGTRVTYAALQQGSKIFFGYYDAQRRLTLSSLDRKTRTICSQTLNTTYGGWDSHNSVVLAIDPQGYIHVAGNMHASPLVYARSEKPGVIDGLKLVVMIGRDEGRATYPIFLSSNEGAFYFLYRDGGSGDGRWIVNQYQASKWSRVADALFGARWSKGHVSAYPSTFAQASDGYFHEAIVWRETPDVASNFAVSYAKTKNFRDWLDSNDRPVKLPITPDTAELVEWTGAGAGLLNSAQLTLDPDGKPVITYTRYGEDGHNAIVAARKVDSKWKVAIIATADRQTPLVGFGALPDVPRFRNLLFSDNGQATIELGFSGQPTQRYQLTASLAPVAVLEDSPSTVDLQFKAPIPDELEDPRESVIRVKAAAPGIQPLAASIHYVTQATNRDKARLCTAQKPMACDPPPAPLYYVEALN